MVSERYIYEKILNMSTEDVKKMREEIVIDKKREYRYETITSEGSDPFKDGYDPKPEDGNNGEEGDDGYSFESKDENGKKKKTIGDELFGDDDELERPKLDKSNHKHNYKGGRHLSLEALAEYLDNKREKTKKDKGIL